MGIVFFALLSFCMGGVVHAQDSILEISTVSQSSTSHNGVATRAIDGNASGVWGLGSVTHTTNEDQPWWSADLGVTADIGEIEIWNRTDCCTFRLSDFYVLVSESPFQTGDLDSNLNDSSVWSHFHAGELDNVMLTVPVDVRGRYVRVQLQGTNPLSLAEVIVSGTSSSATSIHDNLTPVSATQSSTSHNGAATRAIDGNTSGVWRQGSVTHTTTQDQPWWSADLGVTADIGEIEIWNRTNCCTSRLSDFYVFVSELPFQTDDLDLNLNDSSVWSHFHAGELDDVMLTVPVDARGRYVRIQLQGRNPLSLAEVIVSGSIVDMPPIDGPSVAVNDVFTLGQTDRSIWTATGFVEDYSLAPIVIPSLLTNNDPQPAEIMLSDVTATGVDVRIGEWEYQDGIHGVESLGLLLLEPGFHDLGGLIAEAGSTSVSASVARVDFGVGFSSVPVVLAHLVSEKGEVTATVRIRNVDAAGFSVQLEREEALDADGDVREVHYVAVEEGAGIYNGLRLLAGSTGRVVSNVAREVSFGEDLASPVFYAQDQTTFGGDTSTVRLTGLEAGGAEIRIQEEQSRDTETTHTTENVGWLAIGESINVVPPPLPNESPLAENDTASVVAGEVVSIDVLANDTDSDGLLDRNSVSVVTPPANGSTDVLPDGRIVYTPNATTTTTATADSFEYRVRDDDGALSNPAVVSVNIIQPVANIVPTAVAGQSQTVQSGDVVTLDGSGSGDIDGTIVSYLWTENGVVLGTGANPVIGTLTDGVHNIDLLVTDNNGATASDTVVITVIPVSESGLIAVNDFGGVAEAISVFDNDIGVTANADIETNVTQHAQRGFIAVDQDANTITYTPYAGDPGGGTDSFGYRFRVGPNLSNIATITITFPSTGNDLAANNDAASVSNGLAVIDVLANDTGDIDPTTVTVASSLLPQKGQLDINGQSGVITYTPDDGATGTDSFAYTVEDINGSVSNIATVNITINEISDENPVARDDFANVSGDGVVNVDLLANDTGVSVGATVSLVTEPANGSVTLNTDGSANYQHDGSSTTTDSFSYRITDSSGLVSNVASVAISIGTAPPEFAPGVVEAFHRDGQTFLVWGETSALDGYHVYRHSAPIDADNLNSAQKITARWGALDSDTSVNTHGGPNVPDHYVIDDLGEALSDNSGLFVYTTQPGDSSQAYYAVTSVRNGEELISSIMALTTPVNEAVSAPRDVLTVSANQGKGRIYTQFMDYSNWNPTFNGYAYPYTVTLPADYDPAQSYPLAIEPHAFSEQYQFLVESPFERNTIMIYPSDPGVQSGAIHSWWYGYAAEHNYKVDGTIPFRGPIANFTEQRVMRAVDEVIMNDDFNVDENLIHAFGNSMGASGVLAFGMRYGSLLSGIFASQPMTDYATSPIFQEQLVQLWGEQSDNLPIKNGGPHSEDISFYGVDGFVDVGVWDWMDHQKQLVERRGDTFAYLMTSHGKRDTTIDWQTQGKPMIQAYTSANTGFSAEYAGDNGHAWTGFSAVVHSLFGLLFDEELDWRYPLNLSYPAIQNASGSGSVTPADTGDDLYNLNIEWATPQTPFDASIVDLPNRYEISLRTITRNGVAAVPQTVNITPRRTQQFDVNAGQQCVWTTSDNNGVQTDDSGIVTVDEDSLATVTGITITPNNGTRLVIDCT